MAKDKHRVILDEDAGTLIHKPSGNEYPFIAAAGVYFFAMKVPRSYIYPSPSVPQGTSLRPEGFGRHGAAA